MEKYYFVEAKIPLDLEARIDHLSREEFDCDGVEEFAIEEAKVDEILGERSYSGGDVPESVINEVEEVLKAEGVFKKYYFSNISLSENFKKCLFDDFVILSEVREQEVKDWNEEWKKTYEPILVNNDLEIIPEWEKESYASQTKKQIFIYPGQGFGTGGHETTFLCLKLFLEYNKSEITECLDFGCGSGILGIGLKLFHQKSSVDLYDIDAEALKNSVQNIELNEFVVEDFKLLLPDQRAQIDKKYDLVFANILQNVLLLEKEYLAKSLNPGGKLILSGLLQGQENEVIKAYQDMNLDLSLVEVAKKGDWVAVLMEQA